MKFLFKLNQISNLFFLVLLILNIFIVGCKNVENFEVQLGNKIYVEPISENTEKIDKKCEEYEYIVNLPSSLSTLKILKDFKKFQYCINFDSDLPVPSNGKMGLNLGYIDNFPIIYLNDVNVYSFNPRNTEEILYYEKELIINFDSSLLKDKNNKLEVIVVPIFRRENGMGIYGGNLKIAYSEYLLKWNSIYKIYNFAKVVLFFGTSLLFFTLFLGRKKENSFFFFSIFLTIVGFYFLSKLELKYDLGLNLFILKKMEYISLTLIIPSLNFFLPSILNISFKHWITGYNIIIIFIFTGLFSLINDLQTIDNINHIYHVPIILFSLFISIILVFSEIKKKNKRAIPIFIILFIPFCLSLFHIINSAFLIFPKIMNFSLGGDSILLMVISMTIYVAIGFYKLQKNLDHTILREESLRRTFQLYVPPKDLEKILKSYDNEFQLNDIAEVQKIIILFCDIRDFTSITEKMPPGEVVAFLNSYFTLFNSIIIEKGGVIDKLIGDCIMARFDSNLEKEAIETALLLQAHMKRFNGERKKKRQRLIYHGVGVSMGEVVIGNIGSVNKMDFTVIGDSVNLASRLESLTKFYGVDIIVTENLYRSTKNFFYYREIDKIRVKGKKRATRIFQPISQK